MYRLLGRGLAALVLISAIILISGCDADASSSTPVTPTPSAPLAEHLVFQGDISGTLTLGINPRPLTHDNPIPDYVQQPDGTFFDPPPRFTQCSDFDVPELGDTRDSVAVIVGTIGAKQYVVSIEVNEDNPAYTKPGTKLLPGDTNMGGSVEVYEVGGKNRRWQQVFGPELQEAAVIVLHSGRTSGTVDAWMATTDQSQKDANATLHLQGDWHCG